MRDGYDIENRLSSQHGENSKIEEIMHCEFNEEHWNLEEINSNEIYIISNCATYNSINDNTIENNENNKDINSDNHNQINQNIINKKRKRNIISEEKKKMGRKKKGFCGVSKHNKYSKDNQIKKIKISSTNFSYSFLNENPDEKNRIKKIKREFVINGNRDYNLKLLDSPIEELLSKEISPKED